MFIWLFLAWCAIALGRDLGALPLRAVIVSRAIVFLLLVVAIVFFRHSL